MLTQQELVDRMHQWAVRVTPQRLAIAEVVLNSTDHPTVQQIYERVRSHFPSMTLATIYSTLGVLQKTGLIQELPFHGAADIRASAFPFSVNDTGHHLLHPRSIAEDVPVRAEHGTPR